MLGKGFVLKTLLVLWLVSVVVVESAHQKRDVHHRIVLKEPRPLRSHRSKHSKQHRHLQHEEHYKKSKKKPQKYGDSFEKSGEIFAHSPEDSHEDFFNKKQTKSKRHHTQFHKGFSSTSKHHPKVTYHYHQSEEPTAYHYQEPNEPTVNHHHESNEPSINHYHESNEPSINHYHESNEPSAYHENFKEHVHHFEQVENNKSPKWPGPISSPSSDEYYVSAPKDKYNENKKTQVHKNHKLYSSENFEYQQPSKQVTEYYKPLKDIPKRHTHNYEYDTSETNTYKPISTSFQQFESNKKVMEVSSPLVATIDTIKPYTYSMIEKDNEPKFVIQNFELKDAASNIKEDKTPFKIIVDNYESPKEILDKEKRVKKAENEEGSKEKKKKSHKSRKHRNKNGFKYGQVHKIKKTVYEE